MVPRILPSLVWRRLTPWRGANKIATMAVRIMMIAGLAWFASAASGCGLFYQAGKMAKTNYMSTSLKQGETTVEVHDHWGEPDMRTTVNDDSEIWSYATRPNSNDVTATLFYTSTKAGDKGKFLDLKFVDGKLAAWSEAEHTMPAKEGAGFSYGVGPVGGGSSATHY